MTKRFAKLGQLEINETILVIFVFTILVFIGMIFFNRYMQASIEKEKQDYERSKTLNLLEAITSMPELKCSSQGVERECLDSLNLLVFRKNGFGFRKVSIAVVYPEQLNRPCSSTTYPACNEFLLYDNKPSLIIGEERISSPVSIYYPLEGVHKIGIINITRYIK